MAISTIEFSKRDAKSLSSRISRKARSGMERDGAVAFGNLFPLRLLERHRHLFMLAPAARRRLWLAP
ncbi:MAG: hypothetical protein HY921_07390 [Elusimicrobia bacterium]|nr:hypothetical protein [Elusimicrobiota bacterium]